MTDELKPTCNCKEKCLEKLKEFAFLTGAIFIGTTLAILLSAQILKPKCPYKMLKPYPGIERRLPPPPMMHGDFDKGYRGYHKKFYHHARKHHRGEHFKGHRPNIQPQKTQTK